MVDVVEGMEPVRELCDISLQHAGKTEVEPPSKRAESTARGSGHQLFVPRANRLDITHERVGGRKVA